MSDNLKPNGSDDEPTTRKRVRTCIGNYLYDVLFKQGVGSDVGIAMNEKKWNLHKNIIKQSPYLASSLSDDWKASWREVIHINTKDPNITHESLDMVLGSLYEGEVDLTSSNVISIVATAKLISLQELVKHCTKLMIERIDQKTVIAYYNASMTYGLEEVKKTTEQWLHLNLVFLTEFKQDFSILQNISAELMKQLTSSPNIFIWSDELCLYRMLRKWLYLMLRRPGVQLEDFYKNKTQLLLTEAERKYLLPFEEIRTKYLPRYSRQDIINLKNDNILPEERIHCAFEDFWQYVVKIKDKEDLGPKNLSEETFNKECMRTCWIVPLYGQEHIYTLKDDVYTFGFEFVFRENSLIITRKIREQGSEVYIPKTTRNVMLKVSFVAFNGKTHTHVIQESELLSFSLALNEEGYVMDYDKNVTYPVRMLAKMLTLTPLDR